MTDEKKEAIKQLRTTIPFLMHAFLEVEREHPGCTAVLVIAAQKEDGTGQMLLTVQEPKDLMRCIGIAFDIKLDQETWADYEAHKFLAKFGARVEPVVQETPSEGQQP